MTDMKGAEDSNIFVGERVNMVPKWKRLASDRNRKAGTCGWEGAGGRSPSGCFYVIRVTGRNTG